MQCEISVPKEKELEAKDILLIKLSYLLGKACHGIKQANTHIHDSDLFWLEKYLEKETDAIFKIELEDGAQNDK